MCIVLHLECIASQAGYKTVSSDLSNLTHQLHSLSANIYNYTKVAAVLYGFPSVVLKHVQTKCYVIVFDLFWAEHME